MSDVLSVIISVGNGPGLSGDNATRRAEDIGGQELSYAEVKAIASGNPAVLTLAEADAELQRLALLKKNHLDEQYIARRSVQDLPKTIAGLSTRVANLNKDQATAEANADDPVVICGRKCLRDDLLPMLACQLDGLPLGVSETTRVPFGKYRGLDFGLVRYPVGVTAVYLAGHALRQTDLSRESQGPRAVLNAVERLIAGYAPESQRIGEDLNIAESQLRDYHARLGVPFTHEAYLSELTSLRDQLKVGLSGRVPELGSDKPSAGEVAGKIKALKASNVIELVPQRTRQKSVTAAEPVTASIRRRMEADVSEKVANTNNAEARSAELAPDGRVDASNGDEQTPAASLQSFQQRLAAERRPKDQGPGLS